MKTNISRLTLSLMLCATIQANAETVLRPTVPIWTADEAQQNCDNVLSELKNKTQNLENGKTFLTEWNKMQIKLEDLQGPIAILGNVSPDAEVRKNAEACQIRIAAFAADLFQNEKIYDSVKTINPKDKIEKKLKSDLLDAFQDTGVSLPKEKRARMKEILSRKAELQQEFARNIRDNNTKLTFMHEEAKGLPEKFIADAKKDDSGNLLLGFDYTDYVPFMQYAENEKARRRYQFAFTNRGTPKNIELLKETIALRQEIAELFGYKNYAEFALRRKMAENAKNVDSFLEKVKKNIAAQEKRELEALRLLKSKTLNTELEKTEINRWDVSYWQEKFRKKYYDIDQNALRKYFPTQASVRWVLAISETLYDVQFVSVNVPVWHKDVLYFDVLDNKTSERIGGVYLDLFPREGKYGHAAAFGIRGASTLEKRTPISVLVTNFNREGLDFGELETLLHEFGHILHGVLSHTRFIDHAGTSVERDFVEAPSQMFEAWARDKKTLGLLPQFCKNPCPAVSDDLLKRLNQARKYGRGIRYARQHLYASYDMALHKNADDPMALWEKMENETPLGYVQNTQFPGQFGHIMGGYAVGYYGYMWSEALALDMRTRFKGKMLDPRVGKDYREKILSRGSELRGKELVRAFLQRAPNNKAFFYEISGK